MKQPTRENSKEIEVIKNDTLREYADLLQANGFAIYEPKTSGDWFTYSRMVDGVECFGSVQYDRVDGFSHNMPIKPSRENGSSMWVAGVKQGDAGEELTVEAAELVASPSNYNRLVGTQKNYRDERWLDRLYTKR